MILEILLPSFRDLGSWLASITINPEVEACKLHSGFYWFLGTWSCLISFLVEYWPHLMDCGFSFTSLMASGVVLAAP